MRRYRRLHKSSFKHIKTLMRQMKYMDDRLALRCSDKKLNDFDLIYILQSLEARRRRAIMGHRFIDFEIK